MLQKLADGWAAFETWVIKMQFGSESRIKVYTSMGLLLENGIPIKTVMEKILKIYSKNGKDTRSALPNIIRECIQALGDGDQLSSGLMKWIPAEEHALIVAGEKSGQLAESVRSCISVLEAKRKIRSAMFAPATYMLMLTITLCVLLYIVSVQLVPEMSTSVDPRNWTGSAYVLYLISDFTTSYGIATAVLLVCLGVSIIVSLPRLTGRIRVLFDRGPFYSLYRTIQGSTFLLNVSVMMKSGIPLLEALETLQENSNKWMAERIEGTCFGVRQGSNLGVALDDAGHGFPDRDAILFISVLADYKGFEDSLDTFSKRWLDQSVIRVGRLAELMKNIGFFIVGGFMALIVAGSTEMSDSATSPQGLNRNITQQH